MHVSSRVLKISHPSRTMKNTMTAWSVPATAVTATFSVGEG